MNATKAVKAALMLFAFNCTTVAGSHNPNIAQGLYAIAAIIGALIVVEYSSE